MATIGELLDGGTARLRASGSESARLDAELLLGWAIGNSLMQEARIAKKLFSNYLTAPTASSLVTATSVSTQTATIQWSAGADALSGREREVLSLVAAGLPNKSIARRLTISEKTVKAHLTRVFSVLGVSDRTSAALWAQRNGLVQDSPDATLRRD